MKILAIGRPRPGLDVRAGIAPHAVQELRALWALYGDGFVREMHSPGGPGAVLVVEAPSREAAHIRLAQLPLVSNEIIDFELIELLPFTGLERLFSDS